MIDRQPAGDQVLGIRRRAIFEHRVRQRMEGVRVLTPSLKRTLADPASDIGAAIFSMRPAEKGQEPPIIAIVLLVPLA